MRIAFVKNVFSLATAFKSFGIGIGTKNDLTFPCGSTTCCRVDVVRSHGLYSALLSPYIPTASGGFLKLRTGVLPHGAVINCLIGYYDPCEPDSPNQTQLSYPPDETTAADGSGAHVPYGTLLRTGLGTHQ